MKIIRQFMLGLNLFSVVLTKKKLLRENTHQHTLNLIIAVVLAGNLITASTYQNTYAAGNVLYAIPNGMTSGSCNSWATACTLQTALAISINGNEIWVSSGTHKPTTDSSQTISFVMKDGVAVYGGFSGSETLRNQRVPATHITILSGDIGTVGDSSDNSFNVVTSDSIGNSSIIDGVTISGGYASHSSTQPYKGGGGINVINSSLAITNVIFSNNYGTFGGGIHTNNSSLTLSNVMFNDNTASEAGAIYNENNSNLILYNIVFDGNFSYADKGVMANIDSNSDLNNVTFTNNGSLGWSGGIYNSNSDTMLENVVFRNNSGGAGGAISNNTNSTLLINNSTFELNKSTDGGAIYNQTSYLNIKNSTFYQNDATYPNAPYGNGGVLYNSFGEVILTNITAVENSAEATPAITNWGNLGTITIHNSIIWGNTGSGPQIQNFLSSSISVDHSIVQGGHAGIGNSNSNPMVDVLKNNGGYTQTMALLFGSPAIDTGDDFSCPTTDQRGVTRPQGAYCDIGAYENNIPSGPTDIGVTIAGTLRGTYHKDPETSMVVRYPLDGGPVVISSNNGVGIIASLNQWRRPTASGGWTGVAQSMGLPVEQISNQYVIPRYNGTDPTLYDSVLMANVDTVPRTITVTIGGTLWGTYDLGPSESRYEKYPVTGGPVIVSSVPGAKIVASLYELKRAGSSGQWNGQSEMMGLPTTLLSDKYLIPIYFGTFPLYLDASLAFANVDSFPTIVEVKVGGVTRGTYSMEPNTSRVVRYPVDGAVEISSNNGANIAASLNQWRRPTSTGGWTGVAQSMALPFEKISNKYVIPRYNGVDSTLYNSVLMANVDTVPRTITVTIGGTLMGTYDLGPSESRYEKYSTVGGPIVVSSDAGAKIVASLYELKRAGTSGQWDSQTEMMGLPWSLLSDSYLIPIYFGSFPSYLDASLNIAVP